MTRRRHGWGQPRHPLAALGVVCLLFGLLLGPAGSAAAGGNTGRVSGTGGLGVWLKAQPDLAAARVVALPEGTPLTLLAGPQIAGQGRFWAQVSALGTTGWMVGDFLVMESAAAPPPPPAPEPLSAPAGLAPGAAATVTGTAPA
ncbi:MAG TPA: hypothetical protein VFL91_17220, partial [Thermomicrobiales bacterium]|nr:hypothetical protein [Thermomicrobiales bacterium]